MSIPELPDLPEIIPVNFNQVTISIATPIPNPTKRQVLGLPENSTITENELENARSWMLEDANDEQQRKIEEAYLSSRKEIYKLT